MATETASRGYARPEALVSTEWLAARLGDPNMRIVDATYHLPIVKRDPRAEYAAAHIPGAAFFDIDGIADRNTSLPHMLPSPTDFAHAMEAIGIGDDTMVVAYDTYGVGTSPRAWWMLRAFGHDRVAVLDGGLPKWKAEARPVDSAAMIPPSVRFTPRFRPELVRAQSDVIANLTTRVAQIVDARSAGRFAATEPEPRPGLRGGHIPASRNVPSTQLLDPTTKTVLPGPALAALFKTAGVDVPAPTVTSCGSGVTACALALGLYLLGNDKVAVYDGSWAEWGRPGETPVETASR